MASLKTLSETSSVNNIQFEEIQVDGYERVLFIQKPSVGLKAIISIHDTTLGPALGGTRIYPYGSFDEALNDVLRLSKGMTSKSAVASSGFGGGKSVIIADPRNEKTKELLHAFGEAVELLGGAYICAQDSGCTTEDIAIIHEKTRYVVGLMHKKSSGNPSPFTAWGTFRGIESTMQELYHSPSLEGKKVAIQGCGHVGKTLAEHLFWAGAEVTIADVHQERVEDFAHTFGFRVVSPDEISSMPCDVFSPCALGGILSSDTIPHLRCRAIAGCANNQLLHDEDAELLLRRGILYAPDFVINAGGLMNVQLEIEEEGYQPHLARERVHGVYDTLMMIYQIAKKNRISTQAAARSLVEYRLQYGVGKREKSLRFHTASEEHLATSL